jgi:hypothetical protein
MALYKSTNLPVPSPPAGGPPGPRAAAAALAIFQTPPNLKLGLIGLNRLQVPVVHGPLPVVDSEKPDDILISGYRSS